MIEVALQVYRIADWQRFENDRSRTRDKLGFVCIPNATDGVQFGRLLTQEHGLEAWGLFVLLVMMAARQPRPRDGWLTANGESAGSPWGVGDFAILFHRPVDQIERLIAILCSPAIALLEVVTRRGLGGESITVNSPPTHLGGEGKEWREGRGDDIGADAPLAADAAPRSITPKQLVELWNSKADASLPRCELTLKRKTALAARIKDHPAATEWEAAIERINASDFCRGANDRGWRADIDWIAKPDSLTRLFEGKYDNRRAAVAASRNGGPGGAVNDIYWKD